MLKILSRHMFALFTGILFKCLGLFLTDLGFTPTPTNAVSWPLSLGAIGSSGIRRWMLVGLPIGALGEARIMLGLVGLSRN
jgi:hypothetical protein